MADTESPAVASSTAIDTPESSGPAAESSSSSSASASKSSSKPASGSSQTQIAPTFPPPKTDKPRPHVCTTCMRSFARLEHLKRHERSHTKEKPFECPSCTRCFARRDLLLRHQQKLHSTTTPSSRPRNGRRESTTGVAAGRVRKTSVASVAPTANMRPRANTLSHIDASSLGMLSNGNFGRPFVPLHSHHNSFSGISAGSGFGFRNMNMSHHPAVTGLPRIETSGLGVDVASGLRTAPPYGGFGVEYEVDGLGFEQEHGDTINPHALHMHSMSSFSMSDSWDQSHQAYSGMPTSQTVIEDDGFEWMAQGFENQMSFSRANENAIDESSPSAMSTNSPANFQDTTNQTNPPFAEQGAPAALWQHSVSNPPHMVNSPMSMDVNSFFGDMGPPSGDTVSPKSLFVQKGPSYEYSYNTPPDVNTADTTTMAAISSGAFTLPFKHENVASTASTSSVDSSMRHSSVTTASADLVTDQIRNTLIAGLGQNSGSGQRRQSQPATKSPLSPNGGVKLKGFNPTTFPGTQELQRYVNAYIKYFHPHLPFLHIPTLNFESSEYTTNRTPNGYASYTPAGVASGGSCLLLSITAMGALYENEVQQSRDLFECAKRLISTYLEERRRSHAGKTQFLPHQRADREDTPLWLVQAMLLNVIYGHNCGDKTTADAASTHCAALVSLARGAELSKPYSTHSTMNGAHDSTHIRNMHNNRFAPEGWNALQNDSNDPDWYEWKVMEERKRTLYAVFVLSSVLVIAYNRAPALTNSEIRLNLPCDEELWAANTAHTWRTMGGASMAETRSIQFASALAHLLTAAQRQRRAAPQSVGGDSWESTENSLNPSSFGCLILINALHNYIWETRQRHLGRQWTLQEIESMHAHIEPALRAWQSAWHSNPTHAIERPNPFGAGPLSADSIPLLDLAYVRLFVDFGRSKEAYWQRDYDSMAEELAKGSESTATESQNAQAEDSRDLFLRPGDDINIVPHVEIIDNLQEVVRDDASDSAGSRPTQRERHLRKAAFYAADHLLASEHLGLSLNEHTARELPIQSVLCACDSAQVLAEWATTVQERVGRYIGVLGRDVIDLQQVPGIFLLDDGDRKLLGVIDELLASIEGKHSLGSRLVEAREGGYGSRILILTSDTMARAAVWPVTKLMARSLDTQSGHVKARALASVSGS